jgi:hypothetical protein
MSVCGDDLHPSANQYGADQKNLSYVGSSASDIRSAWILIDFIALF